MNASDTFKALRGIQIFLVFLCLLLEIVEYSSFADFYAEQGYDLSAYFNGKITKSNKQGVDEVYFNGVKILYYIVISLTIVDGCFYLMRKHKGPLKRDISVKTFFTILWFISGIANVFPSFQGYGYNCSAANDARARRECQINVTSITIGWINAFLFFLSTLVASKFWKQRQELYEGERRVEALGEVVYKYKPRPNTIVQINEPEQVLIYKSCVKK
ncbi:10712_t:CDS:2 [Funneliformis mosseae]|uniref:10712_t:CDS:1 n=1 Tax=Funneliformis mosseae TaxID=27381 RepID=A0A9N8VI16_FUNMO|nr:10712_t:CDS:2 [Funneliformis mosseae]